MLTRPAALSPTALAAETALIATRSAKAEPVGAVYWLTPVKAMKDETAEECIRD
jgi:hypothetical protein